jgi:hypothetical protein
MLILRNDNLSEKEKVDALYFIRKWACVPYTDMDYDEPNSCMPEESFDFETDQGRDNHEAWSFDLYHSCKVVFHKEMWDDSGVMGDC